VALDPGERLAVEDTRCDRVPGLLHRRPAAGPRLPAAILAFAVACDESPAPITALEAVVARQSRGIDALVEAAEHGRLVPFEEILVVVDQSLVQDLLEHRPGREEEVVVGRFRLRIQGFQVTFEDGFGLVRTDARVRVADLPAGDVLEVRLYGALDVVDLDPVSGVLRGKVEFIGLEVQRVALLGADPVGRDLAEELARQELASFQKLVTEVEIPVSVDRALRIPGVGPGGPLSIPSLRAPLRLGVSDVKAFDGKLWVSVDATVGTWAREAGPAVGGTAP
jgi:hypothetical protein